MEPEEKYYNGAATYAERHETYEEDILDNAINARCCDPMYVECPECGRTYDLEDVFDDVDGFALCPRCLCKMD